MIEDVELTGYVDGELSPERTHAIKRALVSDRNLAAKLEQLRATDDLLSKSARSMQTDFSLIPGSASDGDAEGISSPWLLSTLSGRTTLAFSLVTAKLVFGFMAAWLATAFELGLLACLLVFAVTRFQAMANDDQKLLEAALNPMTGTPQAS
ncbi:MAG: hypothetical protein GKR90_06220 [Pseudomonadales bacterium]|nr:hypothetical protein [Pseudomonadales bacterium]